VKVRKDFGKTSERTVYEFGPFRLNLQERVLQRDGVIVPLTPKVFDILLAMLQNAGRLLTKEQMMTLVWPDTNVEESNLARNVSTLRRALGETPRQPRYIETIPWQGYRFVATVRELQQDSDPIDSLAILAFANQSPDPTAEYLSEGITESLIDKLSLITGLKVMSRNSVFRYSAGSSPDARSVGDALGVRAVLTGRVRLLDAILLVSVELTDARDGRHLWGSQYNRPITDLLSMQEAISQQIAERLRLRLTGRDQQILSGRHTEDPDAYQLYLRGRYFWNKLTPDGMARSIDQFRQAAEKDPNYAHAHAGLLRAHLYMNQPVEARKAAARALELDPNLGEAHAALGFLKLLYDWDFSGAEHELLLAIRLNPNHADAHHWYAILLANLGRHSEAIHEAERARELDPLSLLMNQTAGNVLLLARDYDGAVAALRKTLELDENFPAANSVLGCAYVCKGSYPEALAQFEKVRALAGGHPGVDASIKALMAYAYAASGKRAESLEIIEEISNPPAATPYSIAGVYAVLGEKELAFNWLEKAYQSRSFQLISLKVDPTLDNIRSDPRFSDLVTRVGLN
jgi:TolB-like protein/Flp pilus assembly protein TadD